MSESPFPAPGPEYAHLSERRGTITDPQRQYLKRLLHEAFSKLVPQPRGVNLDVNHLEGVSRRYASWCIDEMKRALEGAKK